MPGLREPSALASLISTAKTVSTRPSRVCTFLGVNSARGEMKLTVPENAAAGVGIHLDLRLLADVDLPNARLRHVDHKRDLAQIGYGQQGRSRRGHLSLGRRFER